MPGELIDLVDARRAVLDRARPLEAEGVSIDAALGRVLAADVTSEEAVPGFDNSAMDGYAVLAADVAAAAPEAPARLRLAGESRAGSPAGRALAPGEAIAISTGAMVPEGADAVVRVEDTSSADGSVEVAAAVEEGANIRRAGEDVSAGERVLSAGMRIGPAELGVLASVGIAAASCARRPRVAVIATGDELREPSEPLDPGTIRNSNGRAVPALATLAGAEVVSVRTAGDDAEETREAIRDGLGADALLICGGVSVGAHDHVRPALAELGAEEVFWGIALKPGKPTWFGGSPEGGLVFGLPGNPVSAMVTFLLLARPALDAMLGTDPERRRTTATLAEAVKKKPGRTHAVRCGLELDERGWLARPTGAQGSHILTSMLGADALAILPAESGDLAAGERVEVELLR